MAYRNVKPSSVQGFDAANMNDKMHSSTLKRQPSPDWSKADLLRLLSYFEGELQARDITIATLKAEKAKQLLYQAKYGKFGLGDPFIALQRDAEGKNDAGFDEAAIKSMYDNQLAQLENLIATQRKAQLKMREQLGNSEKRFYKVCTELEEEKQKHAQDTAQGDDVTYMLEKERERLKAEIDFEKSQNKKLEKDLKKALASVEEEKANAARHKQVAIMLIKERKNLIERIVAESQLRDDMETALTDGKSKIQNMAEGLAEESKKSLRMEATLEKQNNKFDAEREVLRVRLQEEEKQTNFLRSEVAQLSKQLESLHQQVRSGGSSPSSIQLRSSVSPVRAFDPPLLGHNGVMSQSSGHTLQPGSSGFCANSPQGYNHMSLPAPVGVRPAGQYQTPIAGRAYAQTSNRVADGGRIGSSSPEREVIFRPDNPTAAGSTSWRGQPPGGGRLGSPSVVGPEHIELDMGSGARVVSVSPGPSSSVTTHSSKIMFHVGENFQASAPLQMRKSPEFSSALVSPLGRSVPPPIPPNKPNFVSPGPAVGKPSLPPKVSVLGPNVVVQPTGKDVHSHYSHTPAKSAAQPPPRTTQIPISIVGSSSPASNPPVSVASIASVRTQVNETSPSAVRKPTQVCVNAK